MNYLRILTLLVFLACGSLPHSLFSATDLALSSDSTTSKRKFALKASPLQLLSGNFPLLFEWKAGKNVGFEVGGGATSYDPFYELGRRIREPNGDIEVRPDLGFSASLGLRYYFSSNNPAMEGGYFSFMGEYRRYNDICAMCQTGWGQPQVNQLLFLKEARNQTYVRTLLGYQIITPSNFLIDLYLGLGLRYRYNQVVECVSETNGLRRPSLQTVQGITPTFSMGLKLGFAN